MPAIFSRLKNFVAETLTASDVNAEFDNILDNFEPDQMDDYSTNVTEMQANTSPGSVGSESLATTTAGELERLRFMLKAVTGETQWYTAPSQTLASLGASVGGGIPNNRTISGLERGSSQLVALVPAGSGNGLTVDIKGASTNFVYAVNNVQYTISTDVSSAAITAAPSTNNTCLVNEAFADDSEETKYLGEFGSSLVVDNMGSEITSLVGEIAGFKVNNGSTDEYFIARVKSTTELDEIRRGYFFDESSNPVPRLAIANNDTITLMRLSYVFADTGGAIDIVNSNLTVSSDSPSAPALGQYWFDLANDTWKTYNGSSFVSADSTLVGVCLSDATDTLAARTFDQFKAVDEKNTIELEIFDNTQIRATSFGQECNIFGSEVKFSEDLPKWDMDSDLDAGITEAASTTYYAYLTESGDTVISDLAPMSRLAEYQGFYHPFQTWRCVGSMYNDASSNLTLTLNYNDLTEANHAITSAVASNALTVLFHGVPGVKQSFRSSTATDGTFERAALLPGTSITVSSGSTLGTASAIEDFLIVYLIPQDGKCEAVISKLNYNRHLVTTVAEGGAGAADSSDVLYSKVARSSVPIKAFARLESTQATAGTWATALSNINPVDTAIYNELVYTASDTFDIPEGVTVIEVVASGGGGGGGNGINGATPTGASGGQGAVLSRPHLLKVVPGDTYTITIGAGGAAATVGGTTSFAGTADTLTFSGGAAGNAGNSTGTGSRSAAGATNAGLLVSYGGAGRYNTGTAESGQSSIYAAGGAGGTSTGTSQGAGGGGGAGMLAGGAGGSGAGGNGSAAAANSSAGGGGGASSNGSGGGTGGAGGSGLLYVRWQIA
jgi:hypothetical protein